MKHFKKLSEFTQRLCSPLWPKPCRDWQMHFSRIPSRKGSAAVSLQHPRDTALACSVTLHELCASLPKGQSSVWVNGATVSDRGLFCKGATPWLWLKVLKSTLEDNSAVSGCVLYTQKCGLSLISVFGQGLSRDFWVNVAKRVDKRQQFAWLSLRISNWFFASVFVLWAYRVWDTKNYLKGIHFYIEVCTFRTRFATDLLEF